MTTVRVLIGTRKGAFIATSDGQRKKWNITGPLFGGWEVLLQAVNFLVSFVVVTALFAIIYKFLPRAKIGWHDVWIGAATTALLFTLGKFLIGFYLGQSNAGQAYGAAGSLAVLLLWVYYSALILLFGAEFTETWAMAFFRSSLDTPCLVR